MAEPLEQHHGDHVATPVHTPAHYPTGPLIGAGRWCYLYAPVGEPPVGILYTDGQAILGFLPSGEVRAIQATRTVLDALLAAAVLERPAGEVFDAWAQRDGRGLAAGLVQTGDLRALTRFT